MLLKGNTFFYQFLGSRAWLCESFLHTIPFLTYSLYTSAGSGGLDVILVAAVIVAVVFIVSVVVILVVLAVFIARRRGRKYSLNRAAR